MSEVVTVRCELLCGLYIKSCKLHGEQQNVLSSANADHVSVYLGRLSVSICKIYFKRQKTCSLWRSPPHNTSVCHVPSCIIEQLWQTIWWSKNLKSKQNFTSLKYVQGLRLHGWITALSNVMRCRCASNEPVCWPSHSPQCTWNPETSRGHWTTISNSHKHDESIFLSVTTEV